MLEFAVAAVVAIPTRIGWEEAGADAVGDGADDIAEGVKHLFERFRCGRAGHKFSLLGHEPVGDLYVDPSAQQLTGGETVHGQLQEFAALEGVFIHVCVTAGTARLVVENEGGVCGG